MDETSTPRTPEKATIAELWELAGGKRAASAAAAANAAYAAAEADDAYAAANAADAACDAALTVALAAYQGGSRRYRLEGAWWQ